MTLEQMTLFGEPLKFLGGTTQRRGSCTRRRGGAEKRQGTGQGRHANSLAAHGDARLQAALTGRRAEIVAWLREHGPVHEADMPKADDCSDFEEDDGTCAEGAEG